MVVLMSCFDPILIIVCLLWTGFILGNVFIFLRTVQMWRFNICHLLVHLEASLPTWFIGLETLETASHTSSDSSVCLFCVHQGFLFFPILSLCLCLLYVRHSLRLRSGGQGEGRREETRGHREVSRPRETYEGKKDVSLNIQI